MIVELITQTELDKFKAELLSEIKSMLKIEEPKTSTGKWLKGREVMDLLKCSDSKLQRLRVQNKIQHKKFGGTYYYIIE